MFKPFQISPIRGLSAWPGTQRESGSSQLLSPLRFNGWLDTTYSSGLSAERQNLYGNAVVAANAPLILNFYQTQRQNWEIGDRPQYKVSREISPELSMTYENNQGLETLDAWVRARIQNEDDPQPSEKTAFNMDINPFGFLTAFWDKFTPNGLQLKALDEFGDSAWPLSTPAVSVELNDKVILKKPPLTVNTAGQFKINKGVFIYIGGKKGGEKFGVMSTSPPPLQWPPTVGATLSPFDKMSKLNEIDIDRKTVSMNGKNTIKITSHTYAVSESAVKQYPLIGRCDYLYGFGLSMYDLKMIQEVFSTWNTPEESIKKRLAYANVQAIGMAKSFDKRPSQWPPYEFILQVSNQQNYQNRSYEIEFVDSVRERGENISYELIYSDGTKETQQIPIKNCDTLKEKCVVTAMRWYQGFDDYSYIALTETGEGAIPEG